MTAVNQSHTVSNGPTQGSASAAGKPKTGKPKTGKPKTGKPKTGKPKTGKPQATRKNAVKLPQPYWNADCAANQAKWWLPQTDIKTKQVNFTTVVDSNGGIFKTECTPITPVQMVGIPINLPQALEERDSEVATATRLIRIYPKNKTAEATLVTFIRQQRRAYNLTIEKFIEQRNDDDLWDHPGYDRKNLRPAVREMVRAEVNARGEEFYSSGINEIIDTAYVTQKNAIQSFMKGIMNWYHFKSMKDPKQTFYIQDLTKGFMNKYFRVTEEVPEEALNRCRAKISYHNGRWFLAAKKHIVTKELRETQGGSVVAIDPGVRNFVTAYASNGKVTKYGDNFDAQKLYPLVLRLDRLASDHDLEKNPQRKVCLKKRMQRLRARISDRRDDLHRRTARELVKNHDVIFLPTFETKQMVEKENRKIRSKTARAMLGLSHYKFKLTLKWMCRKYGKTLIDCDEAYTSKTRSWDGFIQNNLGGAKTIRDDHIVVDRDVNGARGILLRVLYPGLGRKTRCAPVAYVAF